MNIASALPIDFPMIPSWTTPVVPARQTWPEPAVAVDIHPYQYVLLLDDDPTFRKIAERFAMRRGLTLVTVGDFEELKEQWRKPVPDLVILDYDLGDTLTGPEIAKLLGNVPVLLTSRKSSWIPLRHEWSHNIRDFYHKKYGVPRLVDKAMDLLGLGKIYPLPSLKKTGVYAEHSSEDV